MALIPCPECGRQISTLASSCPGCGCPAGGAQPTHETQRSTVAEPKSKTEPVSPEEEFAVKLAQFGASFKLAALVLSEEAMKNLPEVCRLCSGVTVLHVVVQRSWFSRLRGEAKCDVLEQIGQYFPDATTGLR